VVLLSFVILAACRGRSAAQDPPAHHPSLIVLQGAAHVGWTSDYDGVVKYGLKVPHPATGVIDAIDDALTGQGWKARSFDLSDPGIPTSKLDGWGKYIDQTGRLVLIWHGEWSNAAEEHVEYTFSYRQSPDRDGRFLPNDDLEVLGIYMSAKTA